MPASRRQPGLLPNAGLAAETERQRRQFQCAPGFIAILQGPEHVFEFVNEAYIHLVGDRDFVGKTVRETVPEVEGQGFFELLDRVYSTGERHVARQTPISLIRSAGGQPEDRFLDFVYEPFFDDNGHVSGIFIEGLDVTETYRVQAKLQELNETLEQRIEERTDELKFGKKPSFKTQKMEAVGQLTGGIAHDFNNILAGIGGSLELLEVRLAQGRVGEADRYIKAARGAARRAAVLTQRLLAFARRQTLNPRSTDINKLIAGMEDMIRRSVGPRIVLEVVGAGGLWLTQIDHSQLENSLLNLCINSRDAMAPNGGRLTIQTANKLLDDRTARERDLPPGQYISLCVSDTGSGMSPAVIARAFDPFYTTKPLGEGTGLGLSMVYGFVRQSGGQVRIYSEPGNGTTVCLYLPCLVDAGEEVEELQLAAEIERSDGETVLVIDDEPTIRMLIADVLQENGYKAIEAHDGASGLRVLQSDERIDLLITDVGLPGGINGRQVADAARLVRPDLKVLFYHGLRRERGRKQCTIGARHGGNHQTLRFVGAQPKDPRAHRRVGRTKAALKSFWDGTKSPIVHCSNMLRAQRPSAPGFLEFPACRCGHEMQDTSVGMPKDRSDTHMRIYSCPTCHHQMWLTVWGADMVSAPARASASRSYAL